MKKVVALILTAVLMFSLLSTGVSATEFKDDAGIINQQAVQTAVALNIINGKGDGSYFDPEGIVTRGEMCKMICIALNGGVDPMFGTSAVPLYSDIAGHWAQKYIEYCTNLGVVAGMGDGTFAPDASVTGFQAAKMLLVSLGYDSEYEGFVGADWTKKVGARAMEKGLYKGLSIDPGASLNRDNAAQMVYNALYASMVEYDYGIASGSGAVTGVAVARDTDETLLQKRYMLSETIGVMTNMSYDAKDGYYCYSFLLPAPEKTGDTEEPVGAIVKLDSKNDYSELMGVRCQVYWKDKTPGGDFNRSEDTVYDILPDGDSNVIAKGPTGYVDLTKTDKLTFGVTTYKTESYPVPQTSINKQPTPLPVYWNMPVYYFNFCDKPSAILGDLLNVWSHTELRLIDDDGNDAIDYAVAIPRDSYKVTNVSNSSVNLADARTGQGMTVKFENAEIHTGIARDEYVSVTPAQYTAKGVMTVTKENIISGQIFGSTRTESKGKETRLVYFYPGTTLNGIRGNPCYLAYGVSEPGDLAGSTVEYIAHGASFLIVKHDLEPPKKSSTGSTTTPAAASNVTLLEEFIWDPNDPSSPPKQARLLFADPAERFGQGGDVDDGIRTVVFNSDPGIGDLLFYTKNGDIYSLTACDASTTTSAIRINNATLKETIAAPRSTSADAIDATFNYAPLATAEDATGAGVIVDNNNISYEPRIFPVSRPGSQEIPFAEDAVIFVFVDQVGVVDPYRLCTIGKFGQDFFNGYIVDVVNAYTNADGKIALAYLRVTL